MNSVLVVMLASFLAFLYHLLIPVEIPRRKCIHIVLYTVNQFDRRCLDHYDYKIFRFSVGELYILSTTYTDNEARNGAVYQLFDPERFVFNLLWTIFETDEAMPYF